ncbi:hypothetical protein AAE478_006451 [Parahypoxylon ruwenzoriense]
MLKAFRLLTIHKVTFQLELEMESTVKARKALRPKVLAEIHRFYSNHPVDPIDIDINHDYTRWAIEEALREYVAENQFQVTGHVMQGQSVTMATGNRKVPKEIIEAIRADGQQEIDTEDPNGNRDIGCEIVQDVRGIAEMVTSASPNSLGPPIQACATYLNMEKCGEYGRNGLTVWKSPLFPKLDGQEGRRGFFDSQITAIVWILSRFLGKLPRLKIKDTKLWDKNSKGFSQEPETNSEKENRKRLRGPKYSGGILADSMGLGKTLTTIACLDLLASQRLNRQQDKNSKPKHHPMLILAPNAIVASQWVEEIERTTSSRAIKKIIVSGNGLGKKQNQDRVVSLSPREFNSAWPRWLQYVWDEDDWTASRVIIVMSIDTWARRTCGAEKTDEGHSEYHSTFSEQGRSFSVVVVDEAHKIKNSATLSWKSVALLKRQFTLLVTATPCLNALTDLLGFARILWQSPNEYLDEIPKRRDKLEETVHTLQDLRRLDSLDAWDDCHLAAGRPALLTKMMCRFRQGIIDIRQTRGYLKYFESLAMLRRSPTSYIYADWGRKLPISLQGMLPNVESFTVNIQLEHDLEMASQKAHIDLLNDYMATINNWNRPQIKNEKAGKNEETDKKKKTDNKNGKSDKNLHAPVLTIYRQFELAAASLDVFRLDKLLSLNGFGTKAEHVSIMRKANVNFLHIAPFLLEPHDPEPRVAVDYIKLAVRKSPVLRYVLHYVKDNVLNKEPKGKIKKLLITEASPILAYYYELVLQFLLINCQTLHADLDQEERRDLIASFNDDKDESCQILIQTYTVGFAGSNLHRNCAQVLVTSQAYSLAVQWQAVHRVIRVGQESDVKVYRLKVNNSYHAFRESRQVEKILPELGTRAQGSMNNVLVQLLNLFQFEVDDAWKSPKAKQLLEDKNLLTEPLLKSEDEPNSKRIKLEEDDVVVKTEADGQGPAQATETSPDSILGKRKRSKSSLGAQFRRISKYNKTLGSATDDEFLLLKPRSDYYTEYKSLPKEIRSLFSHEKNNLRRMLSYGGPNHNNTTRVWTVKDLDNPAVLERALELSLRIRLGATNIEMLPLPQIDFSLAPEKERVKLQRLMGKAGLIDQDVEDIRQQAESKSRSKSGTGVPNASLDGASLREIDNALEDEARFGGGLGKVVEAVQSGQGGHEADYDDVLTEDEDDEGEEYENGSVIIDPVATRAELGESDDRGRKAAYFKNGVKTGPSAQTAEFEPEYEARVKAEERDVKLSDIKELGNATLAGTKTQDGDGDDDDDDDDEVELISITSTGRPLLAAGSKTGGV